MTSLSEVGAVCYSDLTVNLAVEVAGGKNLMMSENKMEFDVLAAIIGNKVKERLCFSFIWNGRFESFFEQ